jgi:hypothetical protein
MLIRESRGIYVEFEVIMAMTTNTAFLVVTPCADIYIYIYIYVYTLIFFILILILLKWKIR